MSAHLRKVTRAKARWQRLCDDGSNDYIEAVFAARDAGHTLDAIGEAAGISRQGVHYLLTEQAHRRETYWLGYRHGRRIAAFDTQTETELKTQLRFTDTREHRAFALGELRGYRQAKIG